MPRTLSAVAFGSLLLALSSSGCCKKGGSKSSDEGAAPTPTTTATAEAPTPAVDAGPVPLDAAKKKALIAIFEANKAGLAKCQPLHAAMMKAQEKKDTTAMLMSSQAFVGCRRGWVEGLMPKISPLGITVAQAHEEMLPWDNARVYTKK